MADAHVDLRPETASDAAALALKEDKANKGAASGYAPLDSGSKVPVTNLPPATPATPTTPGTVPQYPIPQAGVDGLPAALAARDAAATGTVPAFVAGAASIAPGTDNASRYVIEAARTLDQASALTLATTDSPAVGNKLIACYALALGETLSIVNGGPLAGTLATIAASRTNPIGVVLWWNGANYSFNGYVELGAP